MQSSSTDRRSFLNLLGVAAAGVGASASVAGAGVGTTTANDWPMWAAEAGGSRYNPDVSPPVEHLTARWEVDVEMEFPFPLFADGTLFLAGDRLLAVSPEGDLQWERESFGTETIPSYHDGLVFGGSPEELLAVDADTGELAWTHPNGGFESWIRPHEGSLYAILPGEGDTEEWQLIALDAADGEVQWERSVPPAFGFLNPIVIDGQRIYVPHVRGNEGGSIRAYDLEDGTDEWDRQLPDEQRTLGTVVADGTLHALLGEFQGETLVGLDPESGEERFAYEYDDEAPTPFLGVADGEVFVPTDGGQLLVHEADTGEPSWASDEDGWAEFLTIAGDTVCSGSEGTVYTYDREERAAIDAVATGSEQVLPIPTDDAIYAAGDGGRITALVEGEADPDEGPEDGDDGETDADDGETNAADDEDETVDDEGETDDGTAATDDEDETADDEPDDGGESEDGDDAADADDGGSDGDSVPGFGAVATLAGLGSTAGWLARRHAGDDGGEGE